MNKSLKKKSEKAYTLFVILLGFLIFVIYFTQMNPARAQNRLDLDDIDRGELINNDRLVILSREKNQLQNYMKFRTNFRSEVAKGLPQPAPGVRY